MTISLWTPHNYKLNLCSLNFSWQTRHTIEYNQPHTPTPPHTHIHTPLNLKIACGPFGELVKSNERILIHEPEVGSEIISNQLSGDALRCWPIDHTFSSKKLSRLRPISTFTCITSIIFVLVLLKSSLGFIHNFEFLNLDSIIIHAFCIY